LQIAGNFSEKFKNAFNLTLSNNSVNDFEETIVSYDDTPEKKNKFSKTDISFSPKLIAGNSLIFLPIKNLEISILSKYVSKQYLDNTQSESKKLDAFFVNDMRFSYTIKTEYVKEINFSLLVNNVFNHQYESNGYTYSYISGSVITENFMFPQAGINILAAIKLRF
jgi:iron complex outermembrane recepter protein